MSNRFRSVSAGWASALGLALAAAMILIPLCVDDRVRLGPDALAGSRGSNPNYGQNWVPCNQYNQLAGCAALGDGCTTCAIGNAIFLGPAGNNSGYNAGVSGPTQCLNRMSGVCTQGTFGLVCTPTNELTPPCNSPTAPSPQS
jgi:hypothetical protein